MAPLFQKHMDDIISGEFSSGMMADWANDDKKLLTWREETGKTAFETAPQYEGKIGEQEYFDKGVLMIAMVKAGVELPSKPWWPPASSKSLLTTNHCMSCRLL